MKNQDADLGKFDDGDLLVDRAHGARDEDDEIELTEEDMIEEEDLADAGDLDLEPDYNDA